MAVLSTYKVIICKLLFNIIHPTYCERIYRRLQLLHKYLSSLYNADQLNKQVGFIIYSQCIICYNHLFSTRRGTVLKGLMSGELFMTCYASQNMVVHPFNPLLYKRSLLAQLRLGILPLEIKVGRFRNIPVENRLCKCCDNNVVENEFHFVCECVRYADLRTVLYSRHQHPRS